MPRNERIVRATADEIEAMRARNESRSDWRAAEAMPQAKVERLADEDEGPLADGWETTVEIGVPEPRQSIHIRIDASVLRWFKSHGPGYQTRMNAVLRAFVHAREREKTPAPRRK